MSKFYFPAKLYEIRKNMKMFSLFHIAQIFFFLMQKKNTVENSKFLPILCEIRKKTKE